MESIFDLKKFFSTTFLFFEHFWNEFWLMLGLGFACGDVSFACE